MPFLVHGTLVDVKVEGAFIGIVRRSDNDSMPITAQQIHSTLAAGRTLLRLGWMLGKRWPSGGDPRFDETVSTRAAEHSRPSNRSGEETALAYVLEVDN